MIKNYFSRAVIIVLIAVLCCPVVAVGQLVTVDIAVSGSGTFTDTIATGLDWADVYANPNTRYTWNMSSPIGIDLGGGNIARIDGLSIAVKADPVIELGFSVSADQTDTTFSFSSVMALTFTPLINASAFAAASVNVGIGDTLTGHYGTKAYRSLYNGSQIFADLVDTPVGWFGGAEFVPSQPISGQVSSMQASWDITVSAGGVASGSSQFEITGDVIPEPASMLLLGLGGLALLKKRRA